jgi:hypothetical protein
MDEIWKEIPDFTGYEASTHGRIKSFWRRVCLGARNGSKFVVDSQPQRFLKPSVNRLGYLIVHPKKDRGKRHNIAVHKLVLNTFVGPCPPGMEACHYDGKRANNNLTNLRWDTPTNNQADRKKHGTNIYTGRPPETCFGERNNSAKLKESQVLEIRSLCAQGYSRKNVAKVFGVHLTSIDRIVRRENWIHI